MVIFLKSLVNVSISDGQTQFPKISLCSDFLCMWKLYMKCLALIFYSDIFRSNLYRPEVEGCWSESSLFICRTVLKKVLDCDFHPVIHMMSPL